MFMLRQKTGVHRKTLGLLDYYQFYIPYSFPVFTLGCMNNYVVDQSLYLDHGYLLLYWVVYKSKPSNFMPSNFILFIGRCSRFIH